MTDTHIIVERSESDELLESPDVPRIGVGEATIPSITHILSAIGIDEIEFLKRVEGTYKQAIKYVNWLDGRGEGYYHAFGRYRSGPIDTTTLDWLMSDRSDGRSVRNASRTRSLAVSTTMSSWAGVEQAVTSRGMRSTSTKQMRHWPTTDRPG